MPNEKCEHCPYRHKDRGSVPCLNCFGDIPYEKLFDEVLDKLEVIDSDSLIEGLFKREKKKEVLEKFYVAITEGKFVRNYKNDVAEKFALKLHEEGRSDYRISNEGPGGIHI